MRRRASPFIDRPVATSLLMIALIAAGLFALRQLPVSALPAVDPPIIEVSTRVPGAGPAVVAATVTTPLEARFGEIPGLEALRSVSSPGMSRITLEFALGRDIDSAAQDVQAAISAAAGDLPATLPGPPIHRKVNPADAPILILALSSTTLPIARLGDLVETYVAQKIAELDGVGLVQIGGGGARALRIAVDTRALSARGLTLADVAAAVRRHAADGPKGMIEGPDQAFAITTDGRLASPEAIEAVVLGAAEGALVRLGDVAAVREGVEDEDGFGWVDGKPAIVVSVWRQPGANTIRTVDRIRALLPTLEAGLPSGVAIAVTDDRAPSIRASVAGVRDALVLSAVVVVLVIAVFLRRFSATLIPSAALPVSIVATFAVMGLLGYGIDNLSLMALTAAAGFVVDDAIVMVENIHRHREAGADPFRAAREGAREITFTIVSLTLSIVAVFLPLLFMQGVVGRLFREFTVTLSVAIAISAAVSLTLTPMLAARLLGGGGAVAAGGAGARFGTRIREGYTRSLALALDHPVLVNGTTVLALVATAVLFLAIPKGLVPIADTGTIRAVIEARADVSPAAFRRLQGEVAAAILAAPDVAGVDGMSGVGPDNPNPNTARVHVRLVPHERRTLPLDAAMDALRQVVAPIAGVRLHLQPGQDIVFGSNPSRTQFQITLEDADAARLATWTKRLVAALAVRPELRDVASDQTSEAREIVLSVDGDRAALLGVATEGIEAALADAFGQRTVATVFTAPTARRVILEADAGSRDEGLFLGSTFVRSAGGAPVPLASVVRASSAPAPLTVTRLGRFPQTLVSFNLAPGHALGDAVGAVRAAAAEIALPPTVALGFSGAAAAFEAALGNQAFIVLAAIGVVYLVLGILYESFVHPLTILSTLPSASLGALAALMLAGYDLDLFSFIGIVLLIGIAKKNAILMIDFALVAERRGLDPRSAILEACRFRFRPIMMTTAAAILGALPLMLDGGVGGEFRRPLGVAIVGGMAVSQILTLYSTPAVYLLFAAIGRRLCPVAGARSVSTGEAGRR